MADKSGLFKWKEWYGADIGTFRHSVLAAVASMPKGFVEPITAFVPAAYCEGGVWQAISGRSTRHTPFSDFHSEETRFYDPARGDKISYCRPVLPDGTPLDLSRVGRKPRIGASIVGSADEPYIETSGWYHWAPGEKMPAKKLGWVSQAIRSFILDKGQPIWFFVPMALPESKEWSIFVAGRMQSLDFVFYEGSAVFDRKRGDELYYAYPLTPDGKPADLTDLGLSGRKGWYVVNEGVTESEVSL